MWKVGIVVDISDISDIPDNLKFGRQRFREVRTRDLPFTFGQSVRAAGAGVVFPYDGRDWPCDYATIEDRSLLCGWIKRVTLQTSVSNLALL